MKWGYSPWPHEAAGFLDNMFLENDDYFLPRLELGKPCSIICLASPQEPLTPNTNL